MTKLDVITSYIALPIFDSAFGKMQSAEDYADIYEKRFDKMLVDY